MIIYYRDGCAWFEPKHTPSADDQTLLKAVLDALPGKLPESVKINDVADYVLVATNEVAGGGAKIAEYSINVQDPCLLPYDDSPRMEDGLWAPGWKDPRNTQKEI